MKNLYILGMLCFATGCTYIHTKDFTYVSVLQKRTVQGLVLKSGDKSIVLEKVSSVPDNRSLEAIAKGAVVGAKSGL